VVSPVWNIPRALEHFREAEAVLNKSPESASLGRLYIGIASVAEQVVDISWGLAASARAMEIGKRIGDESIWAQAAIYYATYLARTGRLRESYALFDQAWETADRLNEGAFAAWLGGYVHLVLRDPREAQWWYRRELAKPRLAQAPFLRLIVEGSLAIACTLTGEFGDGAELASRSPSPLVQAWALFNAGDWESAGKRLKEGLEDSLRSDSRDEVFNYRQLLAWVLWAQQHYEGAEEMLEEALQICPSGQHVLWDMESRGDLAMICVHSGKLTRAAEHLTVCHRIMSAGEDWRGNAGAVARAEAVLAAGEHRPDEAQAKFAQSLALFRRYRIPIDEVITLIEWGCSLREIGNKDDALTKFDAALGICRRIGAGASWVHRLSAERASVEPKRVTGGEP